MSACGGVGLRGPRGPLLTDALAYREIVSYDIEAADPYTGWGRQNQGCRQADRCRLACAVMSQEAKDLSLRDRQGQVIDCEQIAIRTGEIVSLNSGGFHNDRPPFYGRDVVYRYSKPRKGYSQLKRSNGGSPLRECFICHSSWGGIVEVPVGGGWPLAEAATLMREGTS